MHAPCKLQPNKPKFQLPNGERVFIPDSMFIYCVFLRDYKKGMLKDGEDIENFTIPMPNLFNGIAKQHFTTMAQFFELYTRHTFGAGSCSAKKVSSAVDLQRIGNSNGQKGVGSAVKQSNAKQQKDGVEAVGSGTDLTEMEAKADAKTPGLPDWAHGFFSALDKDLLIGTANVGNYLSATPFLEHLCNFLALKVREMDSPREIMEYLNWFKIEDPEGEELCRILYGTEEEKGKRKRRGSDDGRAKGSVATKAEVAGNVVGQRTEGSSSSRGTSEEDTRTGGTEPADWSEALSRRKII